MKKVQELLHVQSLLRVNESCCSDNVEPSEAVLFLDGNHDIHKSQVTRIFQGCCSAAIVAQHNVQSLAMDLGQ